MLIGYLLVLGGTIGASVLQLPGPKTTQVASMPASSWQHSQAEECGEHAALKRQCIPAAIHVCTLFPRMPAHALASSSKLGHSQMYDTGGDGGDGGCGGGIGGLGGGKHENTLGGISHTYCCGVLQS